MSMLLAVDDGLTNANYNWADIFFLVGAIAAVFSAIAYFLGITGTVEPANPPRPYARYHQWAPALLAFGVACIAFALFLL